MESKPEKQEDAEKERSSMKPWEQHGSVINMPRYDYNVPSALVHHSHSGFLITCSIKREKSATKEAMSILEKYVESYNSGGRESLEISNGRESTKRRRISEEIAAEAAKSKSVEEEIDEGADKDDCVSLSKADEIVEKGFGLSLVKLTRSGLVLLTFTREKSPDATDIVSNIFRCLECGSLKSPVWCHRIFPIQATCLLVEKELQAVVSKLVLQFINDSRNELAQPIKLRMALSLRNEEQHQYIVGLQPYELTVANLKFAVGYNRRGIEETHLKNLKDSKKSDLFSLLDRSKCFEAVASAVKDVVPESAVDLKSPELSVLVELLPLSAIPNEAVVAAVSVLPQNLVSIKPRLCIKPLVSDTNAKNGKT